MPLPAHVPSARLRWTLKVQYRDPRLGLTLTRSFDLDLTARTFTDARGVAAAIGGGAAIGCAIASDPLSRVRPSTSMKDHEKDVAPRRRSSTPVVPST